jgi:hypothetical protein
VCVCVCANTGSDKLPLGEGGHFKDKRIRRGFRLGAAESYGQRQLNEVSMHSKIPLIVMRTTLSQLITPLQHEVLTVLPFLQVFQSSHAARGDSLTFYKK